MDYKDLQAGQSQNHFWFKAKNHLIGVLMKKACKKRKNLKILSIGAGTGDDLEVLKTFGQNYVTDIEPEALSVISDDLCVEKKVSDACNLPYGYGYFDVVVAFDVLEHIYNHKEAVDEILRVLNNDGVFVFTVPAFQCLFSSHDKALNHYRRYSKKNVRHLLSQFKLKLTFWNSVLFLPIAIVRILKKKSEARVDEGKLPGFINSLFYLLLKFDNFLISKSIYVPVGLSIAGWGFKKTITEQKPSEH